MLSSRQCKPPDAAEAGRPPPPLGPHRATRWRRARGTRVMTAKPASGRPDFERIALLLQGGGALGSYQAGVYQALAEADLHPDCVAGISIGAINSAIIAGNPASERVGKLRKFWETVSTSPLGIPDIGGLKLSNDFQHQMVNQWRAFGVLLCVAPSFFHPRIPPPPFTPSE